MKKIKLLSLLFMLFFFVGISKAQIDQRKISLADSSSLGCGDKFQTAVSFSTSMYMLGLASCDLANLLEPNDSSYVVCNALVSDAFDANIAASVLAMNQCFGFEE